MISVLQSKKNKTLSKTNLVFSFISACGVNVNVWKLLNSCINTHRNQLFTTVAKIH